MTPTDRDQHSDAVERILVRSTNWLGDSVMTLPALKRLRETHPGAYLCLLTKPSLAALFELSGLVDEVLLYDQPGPRAISQPASFLKMIPKLRRHRFDTALLFQNAFEAALLAAVAGIPRRIGYATQGRSLLLTQTLEKRARKADSGPRHEILDYLEIVNAATGVSGMAVDDLGSPGSLPVITAGSKQIDAATSLLAACGLPPRGRPIVILNAGATNSRAKRWPERHFAELADKFDRLLDARLVLVGSPSERAIATCIAALMRGRPPTILAGLTDLPTLIGVLSLANIVVSNDTGTAHVAAALGRPTLTIFGPTNEFETAPLGIRSEIIRAAGVECERCMLRECPIDHRCMSRISPDEVFSRARRLLS